LKMVAAMLHVFLLKVFLCGWKTVRQPLLCAQHYALRLSCRS